MNESALIVVDVQNDFLEGGALGVALASSIISGINEIIPKFKTVVFTQDWHPSDHISFASNHPGRKILDKVETPYGCQILWPDHCVQGTQGAALSSKLNVGDAFIQRKGANPSLDSYSGFLEADGKTETGLDAYLKEKGIKKIFVCGLATDFCVSWTALDGAQKGYETKVIEDLCRGIDVNGSVEAEKQKWKANGVEPVQSAAIGEMIGQF